MATEYIDEERKVFSHYPNFIKPIHELSNYPSEYILYEGDKELKRGSLTDLTKTTGRINYYIKSLDGLIVYKWNRLFLTWVLQREEF